MKILLSQPIISFINEPPSIPDLGLGYVGRALRDSGHEVSIVDWNTDPSPDAYRRLLIEMRPDVVGVKIFTKDVFAAQKTTALIRETLPEAAVVIGGPHPSSADPGELTFDFPSADFIVRGEAEFTLPALLDLLPSAHRQKGKIMIDPKKARGIGGLVWSGEDGTLVANPVSFHVRLDDIHAPLWDEIPPSRYSVLMMGPSNYEGFTAPIVTTRGCPGKCNFCTAFNVNGRAIRSRSVRNIIEEIEYLQTHHGVTKLMFQDNCFTSSREKLIQLCREIIGRGIQIEWDCVSYESLRNLTDETLPLMRQAGCRMIHFGIESGSKRIRKTMNKQCPLDEIVIKAALLRMHGIGLCAWFMVGFPEETLGDMLSTLRFGLSLKADLLTITPCFPLPGTEVYEYVRNKHNIPRIDWAAFDIKKTAYQASALSPWQLALVLKGMRLTFRIDEKARRFARKLRTGKAK